jgi:uncharacterized protein (TIGR03435 family)
MGKPATLVCPENRNATTSAAPPVSHAPNEQVASRVFKPVLERGVDVAVLKRLILFVIVVAMLAAGPQRVRAGSPGQGGGPQARAFEAVSIKRNRTAAEASDTNTTPGRLSLINVTPLSLVRRAFGVDEAQIVGAPAWTASERYDIVAVTASGETLRDATRQPYLQALLADRWQLRFHRETRDLQGYSLVAARGGSRIRPHTGPGDYAMPVTPSADGRLVLRSTRGNMTRLAEILSRQTGRFVTNDTGLSGEYDFVLTWAPDRIADSVGPSLFTALQEQLGLRLASATRAVAVIVIDRIERPSEN